jgi:phthalate 4,5-cis-dihydrodiol dehydrogenase
VRALRVAILGLGQGAANVLPTLHTMPGIELAAAADTNPRMRAAFAERFPDRPVYDSIEALCGDRGVDAVWIATPNRFHAEHAIYALQHGKHVAVEKPMAVTLADADRMVDTAADTGMLLLAAHTSSYGIPIRVMRKLAHDELGGVRSILVWSYTDWMLRPRTAEELSPEAGSGIVHRQGPHQIDVLRLLGGGRLRSVRGTTGAWMPERAVPGFFTAFFEFEDGTPATILLNGYGYFMTGELFEGALDRWRYTDADRRALRDAMRGGERDEEREKELFRVGGQRDPAASKRDDGPSWAPIDLGMLVVSCARGDLRHSKHGVYVHGDTGTRDIDLRPLTQQTRDLEGGTTVGALSELYAAAIDGAPLYHSGAWGRATLEATLGLIQSAQERREIRLERQIEMPPGYDAALSL